MHRLTYVSPLLSVLLCGCLDGSGSETPPPDPEPLQVAGSYDATGTWNLSSAITEHPGPGTIVADLVIEQIVGLSGVPSFLEDEAREHIAGLIHAPIRDYVDGQVPDDLVPESPFLTELEQIFASVEVESRIELDGDDAGITGTETLTGMRLRHGESELVVSVNSFQLGDASVPIAGDIDATVDSTGTLVLEPHDFKLRIDTLLVLAGTQLLEIADAESLGEQLASSFTCASIVEEITGGSAEFAFEVGGMSFSVDAENLLDGCELAQDELVDYALGYINPDIGVAVGGTVRAMDTNSDALADLLASGEDYSGLLTAVPLPTPTRFDASLTAARIAD